MASGRRKAISGSIAFLIYLGIFIMSSMPAGALPQNIPDFIPHFLQYALLAFFFVQVFNSADNVKTMAVAFSLLLLSALLDEAHQAFIPGRFCSLKDLAFDLLGSACGLLVYRWLARIRNGISGGICRSGNAGNGS